MPYASNGSLPQSVRDKYSDRCQSVFRRVFNETHARAGEQRAFQNAHAAARRCQETKSMPLPTTKFNIYSGLLKSYVGEDGKKRLKTVASSTIKDRAGDSMTEKAIRKMAESAKDNMTIFLNHSYKVPEDVFGSVENVAITQRGEIWDLEFDVRLNETNERAVKTYESIAGGTKLGTSIGAQVIDGWRDKDSGGVVFDDVELLEASIVGIPANPRSWVQFALKAYEDSGVDLAEIKNADIDKGACPECGGSASSPRGGCSNSMHKSEDPDLTKTVWVETANGDKVTVGDPVEEEKKDIDPVATKDAESESGEDASEGETVSEGVVTESVEVTINTSAQEGQETDPESAETEGETVQESLNLDGIKVADFAELVELLRSTTGELVAARKALGEERDSRVKAEEEAKQARGELREAQEIVDMVASLPIGRRSVVQYHVNNFREKFGHLYGPDFQRMVEKE